MEQAAFDYEGISIGVIAECREDIEWLTEFLVPWFDSSGKAPDVTVLVRHDPAMFEKLILCPAAQQRINAFMMDTRLIDFPHWNIPGQQLAFYDEQNRIFFLLADRQIQLVYGHRPEHLRTSIMRVVREVAMGAAQLCGGRFLHASACVLNGKAVIIAGPRGAGKTSLLTYLLSNSKATFLANDRLLFKGLGQPAPFRGMPTIVSIRDGTMNLFPRMFQSIQEQRFTARVTMKEARHSGALTSLPTRKGRWGLSPRQFCSLLDCRPQKEATGAILLFPRQTGRASGTEFRPLEPDETRNQLRHGLFRHIGPDRLSDAFTFTPTGQARESAIDDKSLVSVLADSFTAFDCELGTCAYKSISGVKKLLQILGNPEPSLPRAVRDSAVAR